MPYIDPSERPKLDELVGDLAEYLAAEGSAGQLNYALACIVREYWESVPRYATLATIIGVLENVKQEFYRRVAVPFENGKMEANGDVYSTI